QNHAHSTFTDFGGVGRSLSHGLIFSRVEASTKPGAIQILTDGNTLLAFLEGIRLIPVSLRRRGRQD
ncbi:hypothetical protein, partial [Pseudomonas aeruginosa]|uniref:hypothetical protein n=1 Tax=Pseudomonas aeruginosa TaxID=287 RepID=UPI002901C295